VSGGGRRGCCGVGFRVSCPLTPDPSPPLGARGDLVFSFQFSVAGRWLVVGFFCGEGSSGPPRPRWGRGGDLVFSFQFSVASCQLPGGGWWLVVGFFCGEGSSGPPRPRKGRGVGGEG